MRNLEASNYAIALHQAIEAHCKGLPIPDSVAKQCPWHAKMLTDYQSNRHLTLAPELIEDFNNRNPVRHELPYGWIANVDGYTWYNHNTCHKIIFRDKWYLLISADDSTMIQFRKLEMAMNFSPNI